jgi:hypothetical protein
METLGHVYHTFSLFAHITWKEEPICRVIIAFYAAGYYPIYTTVCTWRFSFVPLLQITHLAKRKWDPEIMNLVCKATLQISDAFYKPCACAALAKNGVCHCWDYTVAVILASGLRESADIQMFEFLFENMHTRPSPQLPLGTHHDWDLMLLGSSHHDGIFEGPFLGYDGDCDHKAYTVVATRCVSAIVGLQVQTPWDPGGSAISWYLIGGLRASRILRRRECHIPMVSPILFVWALLQKASWSMGWAQIEGTGPMLIYQEASRGEGHRRNESSVSSSSFAPVSHPLLWFPTSLLC